MNICLLSRTFHIYRGGIESYTYRMAQAFSKRGHHVQIITRQDEENYFLDGFGENVTVHKIDFNPEPFKGSWLLEKIVPFIRERYAQAVYKKIMELHHIQPIDIVESPDWGAEGLTVVRKKAFPVNVRLHGYHGLKVDYENKRLKKNLRKKLGWTMERDLILGAQRACAVSDNFANLAKTVWELGDKQVDTLPTGINMDVLKPNGLKRVDFVLFAGRLEVNKGMEVLAQTIPEVLKQNPDIKFTFAGRDAGRKISNETWESYFSKMLPKRNIKFLGELSLEDLIKCYQSCRIAVFPSIYEPLATVALEALSCGCPIITTNVGGFPEMVKDGVNGLLVNPSDPRGLADSIVRLWEDENLRTQFSLEGINAIADKFSMEKTVDKTLLVYEDCIAKFKNS